MHEDEKLKETIIETLYRESKKEAVEYRQHALQAFCTVLHELDIDKFTEVYNIAQEILTKVSINRLINKLFNIIIKPNALYKLHSYQIKTLMMMILLLKILKGKKIISSYKK